LTVNWFTNSAAPPQSTYENTVKSALSALGTRDALAEISTWRDYHPTPLRTLDSVAQELDLGSVWYKDESSRMGLGSFKALGGAYAILRELQRQHPGSTRDQLQSPPLADAIQGQTFICATDGNHGRSVAWGAGQFGCDSVIFLPAATSAGREAAIAQLGAKVVRVDGSYDDAVRLADEEARRNNWTVISDTSYPAYESIPIDIMHGYGVTAAEALRQLPPDTLPTHVFAQAGVGGFAASVCAYLWEELGENRPQFVVVEPTKAACCLETARAGTPTTVHDVHDTVMACLSAGDISLVAWAVLRQGANGFLAVPDQRAEEAMRALSGLPDAITAGESGCAGFAGLLEATADEAIRAAIGLNSESRVLLFGTEGATDPVIYERIVGRPA
jgi:diaminopropionate ammonia-lyase